MEQGKKKGTFIIEIKKPYKILECNPAFLDMLDYSVDYFKKRIHVLKDIVSNEDYEDYIGAIVYQLKKTNYTNDKVYLNDRQGRGVRVLINGQAFTLVDGREVLKCSCIEMSNLETATLATEQAFSDLEIFSQSVRCGLSKHICDNSLTLIWANDYFYTLFGYTKDEYRDKFGDSMISMIYPEDLSMVVNSITSLLEDHEIDITFRVRHKAKQFRWLNLVAARVEGDEFDEFPVANFVLNDVTKLKYAEMRARLEEKKYEIISDISEEIPFEYEIFEDVVTYASKYEAIFGRKSIYRHPEECFIGEGYVSEDTAASFLGIFEAARNGEKTHSAEYKLKNMKGEYEWHYSTFSLIQDGAGRPYRAVGIVRNIHQMKKEQESLLKKAQTDSMTGLLNKATTEAYIKEHLKELQSGANDVLMVVDIDDFKNVNDTYGHLIGDEVIIEIANTLMRFVFNDGIVGRIGGDEFVVYMQNVLDTTFACEKAEKVAKALLEKYPGNNGKPKVTLSIGIAATNNAIPYSDLMEKADAAVYQAKLNGKNGYVFYDETLERGKYQNERNNNQCIFDAVVISNALHMLYENQDVFSGINQAIQYIGNALGIHGITIWEYEEDRNFLYKTFTWSLETAPCVDHSPECLNAVSFEEVDTLTITGTFHAANTELVKLSNFSKSPYYGVGEFIQSKFTYKEQSIAYIGYFNYSNKEKWTTRTVETLQVFTKVLNGYMQQKHVEHIGGHK